MRTLILLVLLGFLVSCSNKTPENFGDFVDICEIKKVVMSNSFGEFELEGPQLETFKRSLEELTPATGAYKTGGISVKLTIDEKEYLLSTNTNGKYLECPAEIISQNKDYFSNQQVVYFKMNGVNFDNFKK